MVMPVPMLVLLVRETQQPGMVYLTDKTAYMSADDETVTITEHDGKSKDYYKYELPIDMTYEEAQVLAYVQDDYCPKDGKHITYDYDADSIYSPKDDTVDGALYMGVGWKNIMKTNWATQMNKSLNPSLAGKNLYFFWSTQDRCWKFTYNDGIPINFYEEK